MTGKLIVIEGVDGSGKSTLANSLKNWAGDKWIATHLPHDIPKELLEKYRDDFTANQALYSLDQRWHWKNIILPNLENNINVICDRWRDSSYAYQVAGRGMASNQVDQLTHLIGVPRPMQRAALTFVLMVDYETSQARIEKRSEEKDYYEKQGRNFFDRVHKWYSRLQGEFGYVHINATQDADAVLYEAQRILIKRNFLTAGTYIS